MRKFFGIALSVALFATTIHAESPSLNLPAVPTLPITVIFKDVTRNDLFRLVIGAIQQSKRVDNFVMARAQRGYIEYKGELVGDNESFLAIVQQAVGDKLKVEIKSKSSNVELIVAPQSS